MEKKNWGPDIEDLRQFVIIIRKSGMTIKQLASSFRTLNSLKQLQIVDQSEDIDLDLNSLTFFVNEVYYRCKSYVITPKLLTSWIIDLLNFDPKNMWVLVIREQNYHRIMQTKLQ